VSITFYCANLNFHQNTGIMCFVFFEMGCPAGLSHSPDLLRYQSVVAVHYICTLNVLS
jgi:hypothetical protein